MTCTIALRDDNGDVWLAADSAAVDHDTADRGVLLDPKVWLDGRIGYGYAGSQRFGQIVKYQFSPPAMQEDADLLAWLHQSWLPPLLFALRDGNIMETDEKGVEGHSSDLIIAAEGRVFYFEDDLAIEEMTDPFVGCGCGGKYAMGSLAETKGSPRRRLTKALDVATRFNTACYPPYTILKVPS